MDKTLVRFSLLLALAFAAPAQENIHYASLGGHVTDASGGVIEGADITARQTETNIAVSTRTDGDGRFRFQILRLGTCQLTVHKAGFADARTTVTLTAGSAFEIPIAMVIAGGETEVTVNATPETIEGARSQLAATVTSAEVANLPLSGRNFLDIALFTPGVSPTNTASAQLFAETSAVPGQGISLSSQRNFSNSFIVDGLSANDDAAGLTGTYFGLDVIQDFQVVTSGGQAEFGRAMGGYISMATKSGSNTLHGDLFGYFRNQRLNANNALSNSKLPLTQAQYGASLSGPLKQDRTFYFTNFEQRALNQSGLITISPASVAAINARLLATGYKGAGLSTGLYPNPVHMSNFLGKVEHQISPSSQLSVRYNLYNVDSSNSRGAGALSAVTAAAGLHDLDQTIAAGFVHTFSPRTVNEVRGQFTRSTLEAPPNDPAGPAVSISGVAAFGTLSGSPTARFNRLYQVVDNFSRQAGAHALRVGVEFLYNDVTITFPRSVNGSYTFSSLANFLNGNYNNSGFTQTFGNKVVPQTNPSVGFYAQDEWRIGRRLTLNTGLRYDLQYLQSIATDTNNVSPRAGFAFTPFASRRTVVRGSFGLFYDRVPLRALANALLSSGNTTSQTTATQAGISLSPTQTGAPVFPAITSGVPSGVLLNFTTMNRNLQNAYSTQGSLEIEQQVGSRGTLSASYQHLRGLHLIISINQNVPSCVAAGSNNGCRPNPGYSNNSQYQSQADSKYDGLLLSYIQRPTRWASARASYSLSRALDNVGEFFFSGPLNPFNIWQDYGRSDDDQRHRFTLDGNIRMPRGFQLSGAAQHYSPLPLNATTGSNTIQGTAARPTLGGVFIGRNVHRGFALTSVSARLSWTHTLLERWKVTVMAEAFNAMNHRNNLFPNGTFGAGTYPINPLPAFGTPTGVADPRSFQLALRLAY